MFKLVAVGGKNRGTEFPLKEGENIFGRSIECDHQITLDGVSKKHVQITVERNNIFLEDLGSSNGTFVNGKLIKKTPIKSGDKIALPNTILQLVYVSESFEQSQSKDHRDDDMGMDQVEPVPKSIPGKVIHLFKYKLMPIFYGFNEEYEWKVIFSMLLAVFVMVAVALTIYPVLRDNKRILLVELAKRGIHYTDDIARLNARFLERQDLDRLDTNFLDREDGVVSYELYDLEGRIVRPIGKFNQFINDTFSIKAREYYLSKNTDLDRTITQALSHGEIGIARAIKAYDPKLGYEQPVGVIAIHFAPRSLTLEAANNSKAYLEAFTTSAIVGIIFFGIMYFLTIRPLEEVRIQIEQVLRGRRKEIVSKSLMSEIKPLTNTINAVLQRIRELQNVDEGQTNELEEDGHYVETLKEFLMGSQGPALVLNSEKILKYINTEGEDLLGIREGAAAGSGLLDVLREQGLAATIIELCDQSSSNMGVHQKGNYEISGKDYTISSVSLIGKDKFAKAFYITFFASK